MEETNEKLDEKSKCNNILDCILNVAPLLNDMTMDDLAVAIGDANTNKWLAYHAGDTINHGIKAGDPIQDGTVAGEALKQKKRVVKRADASNFGFSYIGVGLLIKDDKGEIIGTMSLNKSLEKQDEMYQMSDNLVESMKEISATIENLSAESEELASTGATLTEKAEQLNEKVAETDEVLKVVQEVTDQTNLLGLNAEIEAARVGDEGKGFGVVAEEIRKLADNTASSLKKIEEILSTLQNSNQDINQGVQSIENISNQQAEEIQSITENVKSIEDMSQKIVDFAKKLV